MKILKLLNKTKISYLIIFLLISLKSIAQDEPADIWNIDKTKLENSEDISEINNSDDEKTLEQNISSEEIKLETIVTNNPVTLDENLDSKAVKILGLYDPAENGLNMQMWRNSNGNQIKAIFDKFGEMNLSNDANNLIEISLLTNANYPERNITFEEFSKLKSDWLIKNSNLDLIQNYLVSNNLLNENPELVKFFVNEYLSQSNLGKACEIFSKINEAPEDEYLFKFKLYCLINFQKTDEALMIYDLRKELGFEDEYFEDKINFLIGLSDSSKEDISQKNILDFHLAHRTSADFKYDPDEKTPKIIWSYLSSSNLLINADQVDIEDFEKISIIEKATHEKNYSEDELFKIYKKFQFSINQLLTVEDSYKLLTKTEGRALLYQGILLTTDLPKKFNLMKLLKDSFAEDNLENAFDNELDKFLTIIDPEEVPSNFTSFYQKNNNKNLQAKEIDTKYNNKILHQSKLIGYFESEYKKKEIEKELESFLKKIKKDKKYFFSKKDIIFLESVKSDGIEISDKYKDLYEINENEIPNDIQNMIIKDDIGGALLRIAEVIGQDKIEEIDDDTMYFIISTLNKLDIDPIRNKFLMKVLPLKT